MREKVLLVCSECLSRNYTTTINTSTNSVKEFKKFCKHCGKVTVHKVSK